MGESEFTAVIELDRFFGHDVKCVDLDAKDPLTDPTWQSLGTRVLSRELLDHEDIRKRLAHPHISTRSGAAFEVVVYKFLSKICGGVKYLTTTPDFRTIVNGQEIGIEATFISGDNYHVALQEGDRYLREFIRRHVPSLPFGVTFSLINAPKSLVIDPMCERFPDEELIDCLMRSWEDLQYFDQFVRPEIPNDYESVYTEDIFTKKDCLLAFEMEMGKIDHLDRTFIIGEWEIGAGVYHQTLTARKVLYHIIWSGGVPSHGIRDQIIRKKEQQDWANDSGVNIVAISLRSDLINPEWFLNAFIRGNVAVKFDAKNPGPVTGEWSMKGAMGLSGGVPVSPDLAGILGFYDQVMIQFDRRSVYLPTRYVYVPNPLWELMGRYDVNVFGDSVSRYDMRVSHIDERQGEFDLNPRYIEGMTLKDILS